MTCKNKRREVDLSYFSIYILLFLQTILLSPPLPRLSVMAAPLTCHSKGSLLSSSSPLLSLPGDSISFLLCPLLPRHALILTLCVCCLSIFTPFTVNGSSCLCDFTFSLLFCFSFYLRPLSSSIPGSLRSLAFAFPGERPLPLPFPLIHLHQ